jgi:uncharacterized protein (TIGR00369 family)
MTLDFTYEAIGSDEVRRLRQAYEPLTRSVRNLIDATIRSRVDVSTVARAREHIEAAATLLRSKQIDGAFGVRYDSTGQSMPWGNVAMGLRNPIAPPLLVNREPSGEVSCDFHLGAAYEGPPGLVHGGVCALVLDHLLGQTPADPATPAMTGTITLRYLRPTRLGDLHAEAAVVRTEGTKTFAAGHIADDQGVTVTAEGVFIVPRSTDPPADHQGSRPAPWMPTNPLTQPHLDEKS